MASYIEIRKRYLWMNLLIGIFVGLFVIYGLLTGYRILGLYLWGFDRALAAQSVVRGMFAWLGIIILVLSARARELLATEIHDQVIQQEMGAVQDYLRQGGDPNRISDYGAGDPLLFIAATEGTPEIVELLIEAGARIDIFSAVVLKDLAYVERYVTQGNDVNVRDSWGRTLLHIAVKYGSRYEIIDLLITHGADLRLRDGQGKTPLQIAQEQRLTDVIEPLQQAS